MRLLLNWILSALAVIIVSKIVSGFVINGFLSALIAALVIGLINATIGFFLKVITFPLAILTLGIFWLIVNAIMLKFASVFVPGFHVQTFAAAFWGAIVLSLINMFLKWIAGTEKITN